MAGAEDGTAGALDGAFIFGTLGGGGMTGRTEGGGSARFGSESAGDDGKRAEWSRASGGLLAGGVLRCLTAARPGRLTGAGGMLDGAALGGTLAGTDEGRGTSDLEARSLAGRGTRVPSPGWVLIIRRPDFGASES